MTYNFDQVINRYGTDCIKYDFKKRRGMPEDVLPLWVADMDFQAPQEVIDTLVKKSQHGIYGYSESGDAYFESFANWYKEYFNWEVKRPWLVKTPGVVYAVTQAIHAFTEVGDGVMIQEPVYYPFKESVEVNNRKIVINELIYDQNEYKIDFEAFEKQIVEERVKLFILCSPHNPVGRVWTKEELIRMGDICLANDVLVVADEIHADFTYNGYEHYVFAKLKEEYAPITITCTAPSKTFNLAGLHISNVVISSGKRRKRYREAIERSGFSQLSIMGLVACEAAYSYGHEWLKQLKIYLEANLDYFINRLESEIPGAKVVKPEGTYLVWVDISGVEKLKGMTPKELDSFMVDEAKLWLDGGTMFGAGGEGFQRFNIACPRSILVQALDQLVNAINK